MNDTQILDILQADMNMQFLLMCMDMAYSRSLNLADVEAKLAEWSCSDNADSRAIIRRAWNLTHAVKLEEAA